MEIKPNALSLIESFYDTLSVSNSDQLSQSTNYAVQNSRVYFENFKTEEKNKKMKGTATLLGKIEVVEDTTYGVARKQVKLGKIAVLNFANPETPGGGVNYGAMAQEECLCRTSNLYPCISSDKVYQSFYVYHRNLRFYYSDRLIYTPNVTVFKDESAIPSLMKEEDWFTVDVITCSAPMTVHILDINEAVLKEKFKSRIQNIFEAAIDNGVEVLVLGAFGCGAFKNSPWMVAKAFHEVLVENHYEIWFKKIIFAIKSTSDLNSLPKNSNLSAFQQEFNLPQLETNKENVDCKRKNPYYKKRFSILGDSISTLGGYNPPGYKVFYTGENCSISNVQTPRDTWWGKVIDFFDGEFLINNSWSGSRVTKLPNNTNLFPSGCSDERTNGLHIQDVKPDVIFIYLGMNDWAYNAGLGKGEKFGDMECFEEAYSEMLRKIKTNYPKAEMWCCTLNSTYMSSDPNFIFPETYKGSYIGYYNAVICACAKLYGCKLVDLYRYNIPYDSIDGSHPTADGMNTLAGLMIKNMLDEKQILLTDVQNEKLNSLFSKIRATEAVLDTSPEKKETCVISW